MKSIDADGSGVIDYTEFLVSWFGKAAWNVVGNMVGNSSVNRCHRGSNPRQEALY